MYLFFYGPNHYAIDKKLSAVREKFLISDPSGINFCQIQGENLDWNKFSSESMAAPFLANKRLVIVKNFLIENKDSELKKKISETIDRLPETTVLIFVEQGTPDRRIGLFKKLNKPKTFQFFDFLDAPTFAIWVKDMVEKSGEKISHEACAKLSLYLENDQTRGEKEIEKLCLFAHSRKSREISPEDIELLVKANNSINIFDFIEAIAKKEKRKAFLALKKLKEADQNEIYIFSMIIYQFRTLLIIRDFLDRGMFPKEIAQKTRLHPFVISKSQNLLRDYSKEKLKNYIKALKLADCKIKSGKVEADLCLDLVVNNFVAG